MKYCQMAAVRKRWTRCSRSWRICSVKSPKLRSKTRRGGVVSPGGFSGPGGWIELDMGETHSHGGTPKWLVYRGNPMKVDDSGIRGCPH